MKKTEVGFCAKNGARGAHEKAPETAGFPASPGPSRECGRLESNQHELPHTDLNRARLPIPPRPRRTSVIVDTPPALSRITERARRSRLRGPTTLEPPHPSSREAAKRRPFRTSCG